MQRCPTCGQEREEIPAIESQWQMTELFNSESGPKTFWNYLHGRQSVGRRTQYRYLVIPGASLDAHDFAPCTVVTIRAEFS